MLEVADPVAEVHTASSELPRAAATATLLLLLLLEEAVRAGVERELWEASKCSRAFMALWTHPRTLR